LTDILEVISKLLKNSPVKEYIHDHEYAEYIKYLDEAQTKPSFFPSDFNSVEKVGENASPLEVVATSSSSDSNRGKKRQKPF
jgi:hypothetical protein